MNNRKRQRDREKGRAMRDVPFFPCSRGFVLLLLGLEVEAFLVFFGGVAGRHTRASLPSALPLP